MLSNLVQNSLKFTFNGSVIVNCRFNYDESELSISVKDTGVGIKEEDKGRLFVMFGKLEATASINTTGIGLGLSICKKIMDALGGTIGLDSHTDIGTSITFTLHCKSEDN